MNYVKFESLKDAIPGGEFFDQLGANGYIYALYAQILTYTGDGFEEVS
jgi:hypothetical protein